DRRFRAHFRRPGVGFGVPDDAAALSLRRARHNHPAANRGVRRGRRPRGRALSVIPWTPSGHSPSSMSAMKSEAMIDPFPAFGGEKVEAAPTAQMATDRRAALAAMFEEHFAFILRFMRRPRVSPDRASHAAPHGFPLANAEAP